MWGWPSAEAATPIIAFLGWLCTYRLGTFIKCYVHIINATVERSGPQSLSHLAPPCLVLGRHRPSHRHSTHWYIANPACGPARS